MKYDMPRRFDIYLSRDFRHSKTILTDVITKTMTARPNNDNNKINNVMQYNNSIRDMKFNEQKYPNGHGQSVWHGNDLIYYCLLFHV